MPVPGRSSNSSENHTGLSSQKKCQIISSFPLSAQPTPPPQFFRKNTLPWLAKGLLFVSFPTRFPKFQFPFILTYQTYARTQILAEYYECERLSALAELCE